MGVPNDDLYAMIILDMEIEFALIDMGDYLAAVSL